MADSLSLSDIPDRADQEAFLAWLDARSMALAQAIADEILRITLSAYEAFIATVDETAVTASGDLYVIDSIIPQWQVVAQQVVVPSINETYLAGSLSAYATADGKRTIPTSVASGWANVVNQEAVQYAANATNRLRDVGNTLWNDIRKKVSTSIEQGKSGEELKAELEQLANFSEYRADTVARTETSSAYINGNYIGDQALGEFGPVEKVWIAVGDARTRPTHFAAMSASTASPVPFNEPFTVGGVQMMFPHAPGAPAGEVVNCRCYYDSYYVGDTRPDGSIVQPPVAVQEVATEPQVIESIDDTIAFANFQREQGLTIDRFPQYEEAVVNYTNGSGWYSDINDSLRDANYAASFKPRKLAQRDTYVKQLDEVIVQAAPLRSPIVSYRGVKQGEFTDLLKTLKPGDTFTDAGFMSTSINRSVAERFARQEGFVLEIVNPAGTRGLVPTGYRAEITPELARGELEWLLPRNTQLRVVEVAENRMVVEVVQ